MLLAKIKHLFWYFSILSKQCKKRSRAGIILYSSIDFRRKFFRGRNSVPLRIELSNRALTKSFASDPLIMNNYLWKKRGFFFVRKDIIVAWRPKRPAFWGQEQFQAWPYFHEFFWDTSCRKKMSENCQMNWGKVEAFKIDVTITLRKQLLSKAQCWKC